MVSAPAEHFFHAYRAGKGKGPKSKSSDGSSNQETASDNVTADADVSTLSKTEDAVANGASSVEEV